MRKNIKKLHLFPKSEQKDDHKPKKSHKVPVPTREARDLFRDAAVQDGISPEMEAELRRLVKAVNELLSHRVIPGAVWISG
ncbi:hypothetical protein J4558_25855 [Leptolyngbya sp. 15MV]|nr:hypothetical protein J4558_25855 [Leptolyngbya sp. 15MV]